jgi:hypothetical protein
LPTWMTCAKQQAVWFNVSRHCLMMQLELINEERDLCIFLFLVPAIFLLQIHQH